MSTALPPIDSYPVLDVTALDALVETLGTEPTAAARFVRSYVERWPERITSVAEAVEHTDVAGSVAAAETIRSSAILIGATRVHRAAERLVNVLRNGDLSAARDRLADLRRVGGEAIAALEVTAAVRSHPASDEDDED